jgi:hypothetical protein
VQGVDSGLCVRKVPMIGALVGNKRRTFGRHIMYFLVYSRLVELLLVFVR